MQVNKISILELDSTVKLLAEKRGVCDAISAEKKKADDEVAQLEKKLIETLNSLDRTSYPSPFGTISISHRTSVKVPHGDNRVAFFGYLKEQGIFEEMITVNSQTLNSYYKSALEAAKEQGADDFEIPGLTEITMSEILSFRRAK